jgi:hypothetical protein
VGGFDGFLVVDTESIQITEAVRKASSKRNFIKITVERCGTLGLKDV